MPLRTTTVFLIVLTLTVAARDARSQQPRSQAQTDYVQGVGTREDILQSPRFRQVEHRFNEWLSVQKVYTHAEAARLKQSLGLKTASMSAAELNDFLTEMEDKLQVLLSPEAGEARSYMGFLSERAQKQMIKEKTGGANFASMTAAQMQQSLQDFRMQRQSMAQSQQAFNQVNQRSVEMQRADERARQQSAERAKDRAAYMAANRPDPYQSPYNIRRSTPLDRDPYNYYGTPWGRWNRYGYWP